MVRAPELQVVFAYHERVADRYRKCTWSTESNKEAKAKQSLKGTTGELDAT